ncbi:MAG: autotransporter-associated beta strand repeat-containing protein [Verrucomicrobiota bacterium]
MKLWAKLFLASLILVSPAWALFLNSTAPGEDGTLNDYRFKGGTFETSNPIQNTNTNFVGKGYDWSETGWINLGNTQRLHGLSLISPLEYWTAAHNQPAAGLVANFSNGTGIVQATTKNSYISESGAGKSDIFIGGFASALSNSSNVHVSRILDISSGNYIGQKGFAVGSDPKSEDLQGEQKGQQIGTGEITSLNPSTNIAEFLAVAGTGETSGGPEQGDSGSPFYIAYKNELTLAGSWLGSGQGGSPLWNGTGVDDSIRINAQLVKTGYALRYVIYDMPGDTANTANVWTGGAGNGNISAGSNWSKGLIEVNKPVVFDSAANNNQTTINMDANESVRGIEFRDNSDGKGFTFGGTGVLSVDRTGITNDDHDTQTFNNSIKLLGSQNWMANNGAMIFNGNIDNNGFLLSIIGAKDTTLGGVVSGSGGLAKDDASTLHVQGVNTYTGTTFIHDGTVKLEGAGRLGTGVLDFIAPNAGANLDLNGTVSQVFNELRSEFGGTGRIIFNGGTLTINTGWDGSIAYAGTFEGGAGSKLIVKGGATQSLSGNNAGFTGAFEIQGGAIRFLNDSSWFSGTNIKMNGTGMIELAYKDFTAALGAGNGQVDLSGGGGFSAYGGNWAVNIGGNKDTLQWGVGNFVGDGKSLVLGGAQANGTIDFQNGIGLNGKTGTVYSYNGSGNKIDAKISGVISGSGTLVKQGAGVLELSAANTYTGTTKITNGSILQTNANALGSGNLWIAGDVAGYDAQLGLGVGNFTRSLGLGIGQVQFGGTGAGFYAYGADRFVNIGATGQTLTWGSTYFNPGKLILSNVISDNLIDFQNALDLGGTARTIQVDNGSLKIDATLSGGLSNGTLIKTGLGAVDVTGDTSTLTGLSIQGGEMIARTSVGSGNIELKGGGVLGIGYGNISATVGTGAGQVQFTGSGGFAAYGADRVVNLGGDLKWGNAGFIPIDPGESSTASKSLAYSLILGSENATNTIELQNNIDLNGMQRSFEIRDGAAKVDARLSGNLTSTGGGMTKIGKGTLELSGANTYTGATNINEGRVTVTSTGSLSSSVNIQSNSAFIYGGSSAYSGTVSNTGGLFLYNSQSAFAGSMAAGWTGTIGGTGKMGNYVLDIGAGQTVAPGSEGVGKLTVGNIKFQGKGTYAIEMSHSIGFAGVDWDLIQSDQGLGFVLSQTGPFVFKIDSLGVLSDWNSAVNQSWTIISTANGITNFNSLPVFISVDSSAFSDENSLNGGKFSISVSGNDLMLNFTAIPEPSDLGVALGLGMLVLGAFRENLRNKQNGDQGKNIKNKILI